MTEQATAIPVVFEYLAERIWPEVAITRLHSQGINGQYFAAEICLEEAARSDDPHESNHWLRKAHAGYKHMESAPMVVEGITTDVVARACSKIRLAQMAVLSATLADKRMPTYHEAARSYTQTALAMGKLINGQNQHYNVVQRERMSGVTAEAVVLLLGQRFAVMQELPHQWWPVQATISSDRGHRTGRGQPVTRWDIDTLQPGLPYMPPEVAYRVQVKSSIVAAALSPRYTDDIAQVRVYPDLALPHEHRGISNTIVRECVSEITQANSKTKATRNLDIRTEQLLDILDKTAA